MSFYCSYLKNLLGAAGNVPQLDLLSALWSESHNLQAWLLGEGDQWLIINQIFCFLPLEIQLHFYTKSFTKCDVLLRGSETLGSKTCLRPITFKIPPSLSCSLMVLKMFLPFREKVEAA